MQGVDEQVAKRAKELESLKMRLGFLSADTVPMGGSSDIDLQRLGMLIDPSTSTKMYSHKKVVGPILTWTRLLLIKILYFLFKFDFSRVIELHQNVWVMAYQLKELQDRVNTLEKQLAQAKTHDQRS